MNKVTVTIRPSYRPNVLAAAVVQITAEDGSRITIHDCRVLRNKAGLVWFSLPTYSVQLGGAGRPAYEYKPSVELSGALHRQVQDSVLLAYEQWEQGGGR